MQHYEEVNQMSNRAKIGTVNAVGVITSDDGFRFQFEKIDAEETVKVGDRVTFYLLFPHSKNGIGTATSVKKVQ